MNAYFYSCLFVFVLFLINSGIKKFGEVSLQELFIAVQLLLHCLAVNLYSVSKLSMYKWLHAQLATRWWATTVQNLATWGFYSSRSWASRSIFQAKLHTTATDGIKF